MKKIEINPRFLPFDLKVREMCKSCKRFGLNAHCPPYLENVDYYKKLLPRYRYGILYYKSFDSSDKNKWKETGKESSLEIHNLLLEERDRLFKEGHYFISIFGAGGCKLCEACSFPCRQPQRAISPIEATGVNVVKLMKMYGITVKFPITDNFYRIGMILYD